MPTGTPAERSPLAPNHHANFPAFTGTGGLLAAASFLVGRRADADYAIELADVGPGDDVVDVGCGPGVAARRAAVAGATSVIGVDPAPVMLRMARTVSGIRRRSAAVRFVIGAAEALPLPDRSATVVWSLATVHHWRDVELGLAEARRVLRPTGRLLAIERLVEAGASGHASHGWTNDQAHSFAERSRAAGFVDVDVREHHTSRRRLVLSVLATAP
jgi:ubiquinone/menaquinone biosynthesis C-methylase UbiE